MNLRRELFATIEIYAIQLAGSIAAGCAVGGVFIGLAFYLLGGLGLAVYQVSHYLENAARSHFLMLTISFAVIAAVIYAFTAGAELIASYQHLRNKHRSDQS